MAAVAEEGDDLAFAEDGRHHGEVVEVARGLPRVVGNERVARFQGLDRVRCEEVVGARRHRVDVAGGAGDGLGGHAPATVEEAGREVAGLAHHARERGPHQGAGLLLDDRDQAVPEDLEQDRIEVSLCHAYHLTIRFRAASISTSASGPRTTVDSFSPPPPVPRKRRLDPGGSDRRPVRSGSPRCSGR